MKQSRKISLFLFPIAILLIIIGIVFLFQSMTKKNSMHQLTLNYAKIGKYSEGYVVVSDGKKYGYINSSGDVIFPLENPIPKVYDEDYYLSTLTFTDGIAPYIDKEGMYGIIDTNGKIVIKGKYNDVHIVSKDCIIVKDDTGAFIINEKEKKKFNEVYADIIYDTQMKGNNFIVMKEGKYGVINQNGKKVIETQYDEIKGIFDTPGDYIYAATLKDKTEIYDKKGQKIELNNCNYVAFYQNNKITYMDLQERTHSYDIVTQKDTMYDAKYTEIGKFYDGLAIALDKDMNIGYIDEEGKEVIALQYFYEGNDFEHGYAVANKQGNDTLLAGVIDTKGNTIIDFDFDKITIVKDNKFIVSKENQSYIMDNKGNILSDKYDSIAQIPYKDYYMIAKKNGNNFQYGIMNQEFKIIYDIKYTNVDSTEHSLTLQEDTNKYILECEQ